MTTAQSTTGLERMRSAIALASFDAAAIPTNIPGWMRSLRDLPKEHGFELLRVEGTLPEELNGVLYRIGPSLFSSFGRPYGHLFDGDGAITAVQFAQGRALGAAKLVQTEGLSRERDNGRRLYGGYGTDLPGVKRFWPQSATVKIKNAANTALLVWGKRLFALYEGGLPTEISPSDLATLGTQDLGIVVETFSAHPHAVPSRRVIYNFGLRYGRKTTLDIYELNDSGRSRRFAEIPLAQTTLIHDFVATEKHLVFFAPPLRFNPLRVYFGVDTIDRSLRWTPNAGTEVIIVPIDDPTHVTRFTIDAFFQWHFLNGYERGNEIVVDVVSFPDFESNNWFGELIEPHPMPAYAAGELWRVVLDPAARRATSEPCWDHPCEFPRVAPAVESTRHTIGWLAAYASSAGRRVDRLPDAIAKVEVDTGRGSFWMSDGSVVSEPIFVPRPGAQAEDDGWVLALVYDPASDTSNVTVLDARDLSAGPLARTWFDHHVPPTFHGAFMGS
jgi:all-trans-8'-apo-beta-carotenal 15,15'-oxygenase